MSLQLSLCLENLKQGNPFDIVLISDKKHKEEDR